MRYLSWSLFYRKFNYEIIVKKMFLSKNKVEILQRAYRVFANKGLVFEHQCLSCKYARIFPFCISFFRTFHGCLHFLSRAFRGTT